MQKNGKTKEHKEKERKRDNYKNWKELFKNNSERRIKMQAILNEQNHRDKMK